MERTVAENKAWQSRQPYVFELAKIAPKSFGIEAIEVTRPDRAYDVDMLFFITSPQGKFTLRVYDSQKDTNHIRSEVYLLKKLQEAGFSVPEPIRNLDNTYISQVSLPDIDDPRYCVMYNWIEGVPIANIPIADRPADLVRKLGFKLAQFHSFTEKMAIPDWFSAPRKDLETLMETIERQRALHARLRILTNLRNVAEIFENLGEERSGFGLLHNDFHAGNLLLHDSRISFMDFTWFAWGYRVCDIARADFEIARNNRQELLEGYSEVCSLPNDIDNILDIFRSAKKERRFLD